MTGQARVRDHMIGKHGRVIRHYRCPRSRDKEWRETFGRLVHCDKKGTIDVSVDFHLSTDKVWYHDAKCFKCRESCAQILKEELSRSGIVRNFNFANGRVTFQLTNGTDGLWFVDCMMKNFEISLCPMHKERKKEFVFAWVHFSFGDYSTRVEYVRD